MWTRQSLFLPPPPPRRLASVMLCRYFGINVRCSPFPFLCLRSHEITEWTKAFAFSFGPTSERSFRILLKSARSSTTTTSEHRLATTTSWSPNEVLTELRKRYRWAGCQANFKAHFPTASMGLVLMAWLGLPLRFRVRVCSLSHIHEDVNAGNENKLWRSFFFSLSLLLTIQCQRLSNFQHWN